MFDIDKYIVKAGKLEYLQSLSLTVKILAGVVLLSAALSALSLTGAGFDYGPEAFVHAFNYSSIIAVCAADITSLLTIGYYNADRNRSAAVLSVSFLITAVLYGMQLFMMNSFFVSSREKSFFISLSASVLNLFPPLLILAGCNLLPENTDQDRAEEKRNIFSAVSLISLAVATLFMYMLSMNDMLTVAILRTEAVSILWRLLTPCVNAAAATTLLLKKPARDGDYFRLLTLVVLVPLFFASLTLLSAPYIEGSNRYIYESLLRSLAYLIPLAGILYEFSLHQKERKASEELLTALEQTLAEKTAERINRVSELESEVACLSASLEFYRAAADKSGSGVYVVTDGELKYVNSVFERITGYTSEQLVGTRLAEIVSPKDRASLEEWLVSAAAGGENSGVEIRLVNRAGDIVWMENKCQLIDYEGEPSVLVSLNDITDKKRTADMLKTLTNSSPGGIYICREGALQLVNRALCSITGYGSDELAGRQYDSIILSRDRDEAVRNCGQMLDKTRVSPYEYRIRTKGGEIRWLTETVARISY